MGSVRRWLIWLASRPGRLGERAWARLSLDELCQLAREPDHPLAARAREHVAERWADTRDPSLRAVVVETGAVSAPARPGLSRYVTLALHRRLAEAPEDEVVGALEPLLGDPEPAVVAEAERFALTVSGPTLSTLWLRHLHAYRVRELLLANRNPLPDDALDQAWSLWLSTQDRALWEKLDGRPAANGTERRLSLIVLGLATPAQTYAEVLSGSSSDLVASRALMWCRDRGYAPDSPTERAALFVLTGQVDRYRALDPDGALLARAYRDAPRRLRRRLRAAMSEVEGLNPVRVLTGVGRRPRPLAVVERDYLIRHLAGRRAWDTLWELVLVLPVAHAVRAARAFDGWHAEDERDRALLARLTAVRPADLTPHGLHRLGVPAALRPLVNRPPHRFKAADLSRVEEAMAVDGHGPAARVTALLHARLTHHAG